MSISRRTFVKESLIASAVAALPSFRSTLYAQKASVTAAQMRAAGAHAKISIERLRDHVHVLVGSGGNILVLSGKDGTLAVDSGYATSEVQVREALNQVSPKPLLHLVNTHWHYDHTDGNQWMHSAGAQIVAHVQTRVRMSSRQSIPEFQALLEPSPKSALPEVVFAQRHVIRNDGETLQLRRYTPAHTDSDISVFMERANVLHTGDTWFNGYYPFIDYNSGGSIDGMIAASNENLDLVDAQTIVVPGHGSIGSRQDLVKFLEMLRTTREAVHALKRTGRSVEAVVAARPTAGFDAAWGIGFISPDLFTRLIYRGV